MYGQGGVATCQNHLLTFLEGVFTILTDDAMIQGSCSLAKEHVKYRFEWPAYQDPHHLFQYGTEFDPYKVPSHGWINLRIWTPMIQWQRTGFDHATWDRESVALFHRNTWQEGHNVE